MHRIRARLPRASAIIFIIRQFARRGYHQFLPSGHEKHCLSSGIMVHWLRKLLLTERQRHPDLPPDELAWRVTRRMQGNPRLGK